MTTLNPELPDAITVPAATAAELSILTGDPTARDLAFAVGVAHLASVHGIDEHGRIEIHDNWLRQEIGRYTRQSAEREADRLERLAATRVLLPGGEAPLPTQWMFDAGRAKTAGGGVVWQIDPKLVDAFTARDGEDAVSFPLTLLRNAKSKHSLILMLRVLAWWAQYIDARFEYRRRDGFLVIRMPVEELRRNLLVSSTVPPSNMLQAVLTPAAEEISELSDYHVEIEPVRTRYRDGKTGKLAFFEIRIAHIEADRPIDAFAARVEQLKAAKRHLFEQEAIAEANRQMMEDTGTTRRKEWQRQSRTRPAPRDASPASTGNVATLGVDKMLDVFSEDPPDGRIGAERPPVYGAHNRGNE